MKKIIKIIILFLFIPIIVESQNWYPIGATWYFNKQEMVSFPAHGFIKYTVVKDTLVDTKPSKLLNKEIIEYTGKILSLSSVIVREENSKVYYYYNGVFKLMYDFTLNVGDTLDIDISRTKCDSVSPLIVDSIKNLKINAANLNVQYIKGIYYNKSEWGGQIDTITYTIVERVGNDLSCCPKFNFFFNPDCQIGEEFVWSGLRCYSDSNISYEGSYWVTRFANYPCDTIINGTIGIIELIKDKYKIDIFPNPTFNYVSFKTVAQIYKIEIYNSLGKLINSYQPTGNNFTINLKSYPVGIYFFMLKQNNTYLKNYKIIKL